MSQSEINEQQHTEVLNEVLSIQKNAMQIASNGIKQKLTVHKNPVAKFILDYLAVYFNAPVKFADAGLQYIRIESDHCDIIIQKSTVNPNHNHE